MRHVVILADLFDQSVNEVRQILLDWNLCGLVQSPWWLSIENGDRYIENLTEVDTARVLLSEWLDRHIDQDDVLELLTVQMHTDSGLYKSSAEIEASISAFPPLLRAESKIINLLIPADIDASVPDKALFSYRTNLVAIPAQSSSPRSGYIVLQPHSSGFFANSAAAVATAAGLWSGQNENPLRDLPYPKTKKPEILMFRSFVRYADASDLVAEVVHEVVAKASADGLPVAYGSTGVRLTSLRDDAAVQAAVDVAGNFITANASFFNIDNVGDPPREDRTPLTIRQLFAEFWKYVKRSANLRQLFVEKVDSYKQAAASLAQEAFLGKDSAKEVWVGGISGAPSRRADGSIDAVKDLLNAANLLHKSVIDAPPANPRELWKGFAETATALIDGSPGPMGVEMPAVFGGDRRVIIQPGFVISGRDAEPFTVPVDLDIPLRGEVISPADPYLAAVCMSQLNLGLAAADRMNPVQIATLQRVKFELTSWMVRNRSFAWTIGEQLGRQLNTAREYIAHLPVPDKDFEKNLIAEVAKLEIRIRKALGSMIKGTLGIIGGISFVWLLQAFWLFLATAAWPVFSALAFLPVVIGSAAVFIWNALGLRKFFAAVRDLYRFDNRSKWQLEYTEWLKREKQKISGEIRKFSDFYSQYQNWVRILSGPIHDPLGDPRFKSSNDGRIKNLNQITSSIQLAELAQDGKARELLVDHVKKKFFDRGWLRRLVLTGLELQGAEFPKTWSDTAHEDSSTLKRIVTLNNTRDYKRQRGVRGLQELATADTNYSSWPLSILNMPVEQQLECSEFLRPIATGSAVLPNALLSDAADVAWGTRTDLALSFVLSDARVSLDSDVRQIPTDPAIIPVSRRLDIISVRVELSSPLLAKDLTTFQLGTLPKAPFTGFVAAPEA